MSEALSLKILAGRRRDTITGGSGRGSGVGTWGLVSMVEHRNSCRNPGSSDTLFIFIEDFLTGLLDSDVSSFEFGSLKGVTLFFLNLLNFCQKER